MHLSIFWPNFDDHVCICQSVGGYIRNVIEEIGQLPNINRAINNY